ncbi:MAG TPA: outer membrane beta-barrel protein [Candidatus Binatia bacterium]
MKTRMFVCGASVLALAFGTAVAAHAAEAPKAATSTVTETTTTTKDETAKPLRGFYAGGSIGGSFFQGPGLHSKIFYSTANDHDGDGDTDSFTADKIGQENNFMWSVFAGYRMADWLGAEVGWTDLGGFKATDLTDPGDTTAHNDHIHVNVDGVEARLRAWVPLWSDRVALIGGPGIFVFASHGSKKCTGSDTSGCDKIGSYPPTAHEIPALDSRNDSGQAFTLSAGLQFRITDNILLRTEYAHFFSVMDQGVDMVTASVVFGFYDLFGQGGGGGESIGGVTVE